MQSSFDCFWKNPHIQTYGRHSVNMILSNDKPMKPYGHSSVSDEFMRMHVSPLAPSSTNLPHGYLYKQSKIIGVFRKRFIVIHHHKLYSYKSEYIFTHNQHQYTEVFDLRSYSQVEVNVNKYYVKKFEFTIHSMTKCRRFRCNSEFELRSWVSTLTTAQDHITRNHLILHLAGIKPPKSSISTIQLPHIASTITIQSSLTVNDTVFSLKQLIRNIYGISVEKDILILYCNTIISKHSHSSLQHFGVCNNALLVLAIDADTQPYACYMDRRAVPGQVFVTDSTIKCKRGLDVITQEDNVTLYRMSCGHWMNKDSLYEYASSVFRDRHNTCLKCPHSMRVDSFDTYGCANTYRNWICTLCRYTNSMLLRRCVECGHGRAMDMDDEKWDIDAPRHWLSTLSDTFPPLGLELWSCPRCTYHNRHNATICAMCEGAKPIVRGKETLCNAKWMYPHIKKILNVRINENESECNVLELLGARNVIESECNVQKCAVCDSLYFRKHQDVVEYTYDHKYKTKCIVCVNGAFCWFCGAQWEKDHCCEDFKFRWEFIDILKNACSKKIGRVRDVPSIRCCPNCCQLIKHSEACKHMKCEACKTDFCFVCLKMKKNGRWQCGDSSSRCAVASRQNVDTLPANKKTFKLF